MVCNHFQLPVKIWKKSRKQLLIAAMASQFQITSPLSYHHQCPSSANPSSILSTCCFPRKYRLTSSVFYKRKLFYKKDSIFMAALDEVSAIYPSETEQTKKDEFIASTKLKLLSAVSGLNRGLVASEDDLRKADAAAKDLESAGGTVDLVADLDKIQGRWKLIYSSAFSSRTLGGSRPGPPIGRLLPITLGQVFQRIDVFSRDFDNIVELALGMPWPIPPVELTATLAHKFELIGTSKIRITFEKTTVKTTGNLSQLPPFEVPRIPDVLRQSSSNTGTGDFEVTYLDLDTRITRGDRGELRVFVIS